jgi:hypothetical protein
LASSFDLLENGLAYTMLINAGLSTKFPSPTVVVGPVGTLVLDGAKNWRIILSAFGADGVLSTGSMVLVS